MNDKEIWKDIKGYERLYQISNYGNIKSLNYKRTGKEQILKQNINGRGYCYVNISINNKYKNILIHRAVAKTFIPTNNEKLDINHKDGNKQNNRVENLEWCSRSQNIQHAYNNGLKKGGKGMTYKKRCELAIEYIKDYKHEYYYDLVDKKEVLNILKGEDNE